MSQEKPNCQICCSQPASPQLPSLSGKGVALSLLPSAVPTEGGYRLGCMLRMTKIRSRQPSDLLPELHWPCWCRGMKAGRPCTSPSSCCPSPVCMSVAAWGMAWGCCQLPVRLSMFRAALSLTDNAPHPPPRIQMAKLAQTSV